MKLFIYFFTPLLVFANPFTNLETFQAKFTQSIINNSGKEIRYSGMIYAKKPYYIYWKYNNPIEKNVYLNKKEVVIIEPELEQVIVSELKEEINILQLLKDATQIAPNRYISKLNNIEYSILLQDDKLSQITYKDEIDNKIIIYFENSLQNSSLDNNIFKYSIPEEFDIIQK